MKIDAERAVALGEAEDEPPTWLESVDSQKPSVTSWFKNGTKSNN